MWRLETIAVLPLRETRRAEGGGSRIQWIQVTVSDCCVFRPHTLFPRTIFSPLVHCFRTVVEIKGNSVSRAFSTVLDTQYPRKHLAKGFYQEVHLHPKLMRGTGPLTTFLYLGWTSFLLSPLPFSFISECICLGLTWSVLTLKLSPSCSMRLSLTAELRFDSCYLLRWAQGGYKILGWQQPHQRPDFPQCLGHCRRMLTTQWIIMTLAWVATHAVTLPGCQSGAVIGYKIAIITFVFSCRNFAKIILHGHVI